MAIVSILERGDGLPDLFEVAEDAPMLPEALQKTLSDYSARVTKETI